MTPSDSSVKAEERLLLDVEEPRAVGLRVAASNSRARAALGFSFVGAAGVAAVAFMNKAPAKQGRLGEALQLNEESAGDDADASECSYGLADCSSSKCCGVPGLQCYDQDGTYARCMGECTPGPNPVHWNANPWTCKELGSRAEGEDGRAAAGQNCSQYQTCRDPGFQCFEKDENFAACKADCIPGGPDLSDWDDQPWTCKKLGEPAPFTQPWVQEACSEGLDNCVSTACCKVPGQQCFLQNDYYGNCMTACVGVGDGDPWSCKPLGQKTPDPPIKSGKYGPWVLDKCSGMYEGCKESKCCVGANVQCYEKNEDWAACQETCKPGKNPFDNNETWSCKELGPRSYGVAMKGYPSLYCFALARLQSYEGDLLRAMMKRETGIFECDDFAVLTAETEEIIESGNLKIKTVWFKNAPVVTSQDGTAGNTRLFVNAWNAVIGLKTWKNHSWIVKADPDAVVLPERLRWHLAAHTGEHVFILNCNKYPGPNYPMVYGALEVFSNSAIQAWAERGNDCYAPDTYGEDYYITRCMDHLGVNRILDEQILGDNLCMGADCNNGWTAAFHPYKDEASWTGCYNTATQTPM